MYKIFTETYKVKKDCSKKRKDQTVAMNEWYANFHMVKCRSYTFFMKRAKTPLKMAQSNCHNDMWFSIMICKKNILIKYP